MDGIAFKVREGSKVINKTIFLTLGPTEKDKKEDLGMPLGKYENNSFLDECPNRFKNLYC
jgi:putative transposase